MPNTLTVQTWDLVLPRPSQVLVTNPDRAVAVSFLENCFTDTQQGATLRFFKVRSRAVEKSVSATRDSTATPQAGQPTAQWAVG